MRRFFNQEVKIFTGLVALVAIILMVWQPVSFPELVQGIEKKRLIKQVTDTGRCQLGEAALLAASPKAVALCANYGPEAYQDAVLLPEAAELVWGEFGFAAEWQQARLEHGLKALRVVNHYMVNGSNVSKAKRDLGVLMEQLFAGEKIEMAKAMTSREFGADAILNIASDYGDIFLAQFAVLEDGTVTRLNVESAVQIALGAILSGTKSFELKAARDQELTWKDYGGVVLDAAIIYGGVKLLTKPLLVKGVAVKGGTSAAKVGRLASLKAALAKGSKVLTVSKNVGAVALTGTVLYVAVIDPVLIPKTLVSMAGWAAELVGWNAWVGYLIAGFVLALALYLLAWPLRLVVRLVKAFLQPILFVKNRYPV